jgi:hypothetical protein
VQQASGFVGGLAGRVELRVDPVAGLSKRFGQRGWKRQPAGSAAGSGNSPPSALRCLRGGTASTNACV